jgi:M6 family metalloprotease-like protein
MKTSKVLIAVVFLFCVLASSMRPDYATAMPPDHLGIKAVGPQYYPPVSPASGPQNTLAILVEFSDVKHTANKTAIDDMIFSQMAKYYSDVSYGEIQVIGKSVGWYQLPNPMSFYGADLNPSQPGSDANPVQLIRDAITAAEADVDFNAYSKIVVVHAGAGQEDAVSTSDNIWSEAYWYDLQIQANNGAVVNAAAIAPEMETHGHSPLGVYSHEYGHLLGLLDLYDANAHSDTPDPFVGRWSLMGPGLWLGNPPGTSPAELEAWSRVKLGWLMPDSVQLSTGNLSLQSETLHPLETSSGTRAIKITTKSSTDYYMVELRDKVGFDKNLPSSGILITRIDESRDSGGGIVQVMDANASTNTLNDAPYQVGENFEDPARHVFITIRSRTADIFTVLVANQKLSGLTLQNTQIIVPRAVNATYLRQATISAIITDLSGNRLSGLPVKLQYYDHEQWYDIDTNETDNEGIAHFEEHFALKPGEYYVRFLFTGGKFGDLYLAGSDQLTTLNLGKLATRIQFSSSPNMQAAQPITITVKATDEFGNLVENLQADIWLDNRLITSQRLVDGTMNITLAFGWYQLGEHILTVAVSANPYFGGSTGFLDLNVVAPIWLYEVSLLVAVVAASASSFLLFLRRKPSKRKRRRSVRRKR